MAVPVEHDKRRKKILEKSLSVFIEDGFENATFQKIADRCGITRTILYLYFKNKKEIFTYSIKQMLLSVEEKLNMICNDKSLNSIEKITSVLLAISELCEKNSQLLFIVSDYLLHISKSDINPETRVRRRTVKMRHILSSLVIEGVKTGELKKIDIKTTSDFLYTFIEAAVFQLVIFKRRNLDEYKKTIVFAVKQLAT
jgi:AcrR family transcriptional regulator